MQQLPILSAFPIGKPNDAYAQYFDGQSYLAMLSTEQVFIANVTFEPGCRNHWHIHHSTKGGGQMLICVYGNGWYQEWGKPARALKPGDVVNIPANVKHWHGAAKDSWFQHLAVEVAGENTSNEWCEAVSQKDYENLSSTSLDPEFDEFFSIFADKEVISESKLDPRTRYMAILAALMGCQGIEEFKIILPKALDNGVTASEIKEIIYQGTAYLGIGSTREFLKVANEIFTSLGISLPLPSASTTAPENRVELGNQAQVEIFGQGMKGFQDSGPQETRHINKWLAGNCFGDYYTRKGLNLRERELITFCYIAAQGGCEPQLTAHAKGNMNMGNDKAFLIDVISQCLPYIGYPRSLNALQCVNKAAE